MAIGLNNLVYLKDPGIQYVGQLNFGSTIMNIHKYGLKRLNNNSEWMLKHALQTSYEWNLFSSCQSFQIQR